MNLFLYDELFFNDHLPKTKSQTNLSLYIKCNKMSKDIVKECLHKV